MEDKFNQFLESAEARDRDFIVEINDFLMRNNCKREIKTAASGYVVSYILQDSKKTIANFVMRKTGVKLRIYPEHIARYQDFLNTLPGKMKQEIKKASVCKRLINPEECNPKCVKGYSFAMDGEVFQKCRYMAFMPTLNEENNPYIKQFLQNELSEK